MTVDAQTPSAGADVPVVQASCVLTSCEGLVELMRGQGSWMTAAAESTLSFGDRIRTGEYSRAAVRLPGGSVLRINELSTIVLEPPSAAGGAKGRVGLVKGAAYYFGRNRPESVEVSTPVANGAIRGTELVISVAEDGATQFTVVDGAVAVESSRGTIELSNGEQGDVSADGTLRKSPAVDVSAVMQWTLYYPKILEPTASDSAGTSSADGDDALYATAERQLCAGQVAQAQATLKQTSADGAKRLALEELIAVVLGHADAVDVAKEPTSASQWMARSYTLQARLQLSEALDAATHATADSPNFAGAWARVGELEFSFGRLGKAQDALDKALALDPANAQARTLQGFVLAGQGRYAKAAEAFENAINTDPALGNAWLGRGLVRISQGEGGAGRQDLLQAAALEPNRSLLRSYLAKAFTDASRWTLAEHELELAAKLDPADPTPHLYRALFEQQRNRPIVAARALERSITLNDNRALFRSRLLLDQDAAVRRANLASIYQDAGLADRALAEAGRAVQEDYANASAHLFLANAYEARLDPAEIDLRYETPHMNEVMLANLFAPVGAGTLSPNLSNQEYGGLFMRRGFDGSAAVTLDSRGRYNLKAGQNWTAPKTEYSVAFSRTEYDTYIKNDDLERSILDVTVKQTITQHDTALFYLRWRESEQGDLYPLYNPSRRDPSYRTSFNQRPFTWLGWRHQWDEEHQTILLGGRMETDETFSSKGYGTNVYKYLDGKYGLSLTNTYGWYSERQAGINFAELQDIWTLGDWQLLWGAGLQEADYDALSRFNITGINPLAPHREQRLTVPARSSRAYVETRWQAQSWLKFTAALGYEYRSLPINLLLPPYMPGTVETESLTPRAGVVAGPFRGWYWRAAAGRSLGGYWADEPLQLEPSQTAGLLTRYRSLVPEAFTGSLPAAQMDVFQTAIDGRIGENVFAGLEWFVGRASAHREWGGFYTLGASVFERFDLNGETIQYDENRTRIWVGGLLDACWSWDTDIAYSSSRIESTLEVPVRYPPAYFTPAGITTAELYQGGVGVNYHHSSGWFGRVEGRFYGQSTGGTAAQLPDELFAQANANFGYRLKSGRGEFSLAILNITGRDFRLYPLSYYREPPRETTVVYSMKINF
ncbi:MAG: FecR domain-containing protein [Verrucomicrobiota bacterium]|nr:FecR domain-containing protein [Verrucomicrobiota bacterium]